MQHIGVDGCRAGWIAVTKRDGALIYKISPTLAELLLEFPAAERVFVDIPIGLPSSVAPNRKCDHLARAVFTGRRSSVFPAPCRGAAHAGDLDEAKRINKQVVGRSLSVQSWGICRKIAEVDRLITTCGETKARVREIHPEVCFWAFAGSAMRFRKNTIEGINERIAVLRRLESDTEPFLMRTLRDEPRKRVRPDDVLDALAAYMTACAPTSKLRSLCGDPARDESGLPMEMVYAAL